MKIEQVGVGHLSCIALTPAVKDWATIMTASPLALYRKYFLDRHFERLDLFQLIAAKYEVRRVLYAGSFVHIAPSLVFRSVVYVDLDKRARLFFNAPEVLEYINEKKCYPQAAQVRFHLADYRDGIPEAPGSFDLLLSQYAGFVGKHCKPYLKKNGLLLANNSHGDAGLAAIDGAYRLIAVFSLRRGQYRISEDNLDEYFIPKAPGQATWEYLEKQQKGIGYRRTSSAYLFRKNR